MIQRFIELGEGYGDLFELCELIRTNEDRIYRTFLFPTTINGKPMVSFAVALNSVGESKFMPIYTCREGIPAASKRTSIFMDACKHAGHHPVEVELKPSSTFADKGQYHQYLIGILRLNHLLPEMS